MKRGIEYLLVLGFAGILAAIFFPVFSQSRDKARAASRLAQRVQTAASPLSGLMAMQKPAGESTHTPLPNASSRHPAGPRFAAPVARGGAPVQMASLGAAAAPVPAKPIRDPNMYLSNSYMGGRGAKDRLETLIRNGVVVDGKRVKLEAFSRDYAQAFPIPTRTALSLVADTQHGKIVTQGDRTFLQVGLQAIRGEAPRRPPLNVALVIDCSGSMGSEEKLEHAKDAAVRLVERLRPGDVLSIVTFDHQASVVLPAQPVGDGTRARRLIGALAPGSDTNLFDGLQRGYQEARKNAARDEVVSRVLLLSDGEVTAGVNDPLEFRRLASQMADRDIQVTTVGMGVSFNEELMLALARDGKGNYHFIRDGADTATVFAKELEELTHVVARAVRLRIRLAKDVGLVRVLGATRLDAAGTQAARAEEKKIDRKVYEELGIAVDRQKAEEEPGIKLLIPHFYRGDHHLVMLEVAVPPGRTDRRVADVFLKYKDMIARANRETSARVTVRPAGDRAEMIASLNRGVKKNLLGFQTGEALAEAAALIAQGRIAEAVRTLDERMVVLGLAAREWGDRDLERDGRLLDRYKTVVTHLRDRPHLASGEFGEYLKKSLTYSGYQRTR